MQCSVPTTVVVPHVQGCRDAHATAMLLDTRLKIAFYRGVVGLSW